MLRMKFDVPRPFQRAFRNRPEGTHPTSADVEFCYRLVSKAASSATN